MPFFYRGSFQLVRERIPNSREMRSIGLTAHIVAGMLRPAEDKPATSYIRKGIATSRQTLFTRAYAPLFSSALDALPSHVGDSLDKVNVLHGMSKAIGALKTIGDAFVFMVHAASPSAQSRGVTLRSATHFIGIAKQWRTVAQQLRALPRPSPSDNNPDTGINPLDPAVQLAVQAPRHARRERAEQAGRRGTGHWRFTPFVGGDNAQIGLLTELTGSAWCIYVGRVLHSSSATDKTPHGPVDAMRAVDAYNTYHFERRPDHDAADSPYDATVALDPSPMTMHMGQLEVLLGM